MYIVFIFYKKISKKTWQVLILDVLYIRVSTQDKKVLKGDNMKLDDRKKKILSSVVEDYIISAEPVGSQTLVDKYHLEYSSATIRNEMKQLEESGYLEQPHVSAR